MGEPGRTRGPSRPSKTKVKQQSPAVAKYSTQPEKSASNYAVMLDTIVNPKMMNSVSNGDTSAVNQLSTGGKMTEQGPLTGVLTQLGSIRDEGICPRPENTANTAITVHERERTLNQT